MDKLILELIKESREIIIKLQDIERRVKQLESEADELGSIGVL